jgi:biopolymer transport protein ExbB
MGLLEAFTALANGEGLTATSALSEGISSALWTTQLGLVIAVPAWMLLSYMKNLSTREELANAIQPATAP